MNKSSILSLLLSYLSRLWLKQRSRRRTQACRRKWGWAAAGHWWTLGRCCSLWTQSRRGQEASGLLPASVEEEAGCKQWRGLDCKHSLLLLIQKTVGGSYGWGAKRRERKGIRVRRAKEIWNVHRILWDYLSREFLAGQDGSSFYKQTGSRHIPYISYYHLKVRGK